MDVSVQSIEGVTVVKVSGDIDAATAPGLMAQMATLTPPGCRIAVDLSEVPYMSSAGLRVMLSLYRNVTASKGKVVLAGVVEEIGDTMSNTGFLNFFTMAPDVPAALALLR
jgi:anti-sigma B factor antagonist